MMAHNLAALNCAGGSAYLDPRSVRQQSIFKAATHLNSCLSALAASFAAVSLEEARSQSSNKSVQSSEAVAVRKPMGQVSETCEQRVG